MTAALIAVLALAAERLARPYPDPAPTPDWDQLADQAAINATFDEMIRHWNQDAT